MRSSAVAQTLQRPLAICRSWLRGTRRGRQHAESRTMHTKLMLGLLAVISGCAAPRDADVALKTEALSTSGYSNVAWEELDGASIAELRTQLPLLQGRGIALVLQWKADNLDDAERWELVFDALDRGIPVYPWLTLPEDVGYFPNATNYDMFIGSAQYLMFVWRTLYGLPPTTFLVDMEMSKSKLEEFQRLTASGDLFGTARFLNRNIDRTQYREAALEYRKFVDYAHALGFRITVTTLLPLLEDYTDGDDFLRQGFNCPLDGPDWDEVSIQAQRTLYAKSYPLTSYMVYEFGRLAKERFGDKAGLGLGLTHPGISPDSSIVYRNADELRLDVEAARAAGFSSERVGVYSFLGIYRRDDDWFQEPTNAVPSIDSGTLPLRAAMQTLDALDAVR